MKCTSSRLNALAVGIACAALTLSGCGGAAPKAEPPPVEARIEGSYNGPRIRVAVGSFSELEDTKALLEQLGFKGIAPMITEQITTGLVKTNRVTVLERSQIGKVIGNTQLEKESDMSKYFDQGTTVEVGKLVGAQAVLVGVVTEFEPNVSGGGAGIDVSKLGGAKYHQEKAVVGIDVRLVEQQTGKVIVAANGKAEVDAKKFDTSVGYLGIGANIAAYGKTPLGEATRRAANNALVELVKAIETIPWEGGVLDVKGPEKVFIDAGQDLNLKAGDRFRVVLRGDPIKDPEGNVVGYDDTEGGIVELTQVQAKMSIAKVIEGAGPQKAGDRVRHVIKTN